MLIAREPVPSANEVLQVEPGKVERNPHQPRKGFPAEELEMLKSSIARDGFLQPIVVRRLDGDRTQLIAGERRLRAAQELGLPTIPAIVADVDDDRLLELALVENVQREDLNPIELAEGYRSLMSLKGWTQELLAEALGVSRSSVANTLRLLELPSDMQSSIARGHISMGHAKVLLSVEDAREQRLLYERIAEEKLSVRDLEEQRDETRPGSRRGDEGKRPPRRRTDSTPPHVVSLEEQFSERLGTRVRIKERKGRGRIVVEFYSADDFERIRGIVLGS
jgi:ParB family chromosome partitioning protein